MILLVPENAARPRGRPARGAAPLSRGRVVAAAMAMIEEDGPEHVTMRGLARRLGVTPMSLYHHVESRDALLDAVAAQVLDGFAPPSPTGDLATDVRAMAHAFRDAALQHPRSAPLVLSRQLDSARALAPTERALAALRAAGFPPDRAVSAVRAVLAYVVGTLLREVTAGPVFSDAEGAARRQAALAASGLPHVVESAAHLAVCDHDGEFAYGLDLLITALVG
jgi:TetR/AcrR family tetracycline transcriptional repressor